jgi:hypothetical protein
VACQQRVRLDEFGGIAPGLVNKFTIFGDSHERETRASARLPITQDIAFAAQLKIDGGKFEAVGSGSDGINPFPSGSVWFAVGDEQTHTSVLASTYSPAQLV